VGTLKSIISLSGLDVYLFRKQWRIAMSFDIVVIRLRRVLSTLNDWTAGDVAEPLGSIEQIRGRCSAVFAGTTWSSDWQGLWMAPSGCALEFNIPKDVPPSSLHLCLHFGDSWSDETQTIVFGLFTRLFCEFQWQSFAVSDNSALFEYDNKV